MAVRLVLNKYTISLLLKPILFVTKKTPIVYYLKKDIPRPIELYLDYTLLLTVSSGERSTKDALYITNYFKGRINSPIIKLLKKEAIIEYNFLRNILENTIINILGNRYYSTLVNIPTRSIRGSN